MAALATWQDVQARWRPLTPAEQAVVTAWLADASALIRRKVPGIDARIAADPDFAALVVSVACRMVLRVMRNPDGKVQERIDDYEYTRAQATRDGSLYLSDDDLELLTDEPGPDGAWTISPGSAGPYLTGRWR